MEKEVRNDIDVMLMHEILRNKMQKLLIMELVGINTKECTLPPGRHCGEEGQRTHAERTSKCTPGFLLLHLSQTTGIIRVTKNNVPLFSPRMGTVLQARRLGQLPQFDSVSVL